MIESFCKTFVWLQTCRMQTAVETCIICGGVERAPFLTKYRVSLNKLASLGATLVRNSAHSLTHWLTDLLTGVKCRATSVAKNHPVWKYGLNILNKESRFFSKKFTITFQIISQSQWLWELQFFCFRCCSRFHKNLTYDRIFGWEKG